MRKIFFPIMVMIFMGLASFPASATSATAEPGLAGNFTDAVDLWYLGPLSYRKAGLNIENPNNVVKLVTGIQMTFNLSDAPQYSAKVKVQRDNLDNRNDAFIEHQITGFHFGNERTQNFFFSEDEYLMVDDDYNIQFQPTKPQHIELQCLEGDGVEEKSFFWDPITGDWATNVPESPNSPNIVGEEWAMSALVETAGRLSMDIPFQNSVSSPDLVDGFYVNLDKDKTYVFFLEHSPAAKFRIYVYGDRDMNGIPGKLNGDTLIASSSGSGVLEMLTMGAQYTGRYYILVKPQESTGGIYELKFTENSNPVAVAGEDMYANLMLDGSIVVNFENTLSYDPDDDLNNNKEIDQSETDDLEYYWDFDHIDDVPEVFANWDGNGQRVMERFGKGGKYTVTLAVVDPYGAYAMDTFDLYLNYIPVVKMEIEGLVKGTADVGEKLTCLSEGTYDPDDDLNGNGIIDGSETDHLSYGWDFHDTIDKNMDGNYTNDTDALNKMWLMKYTTPGDYRVTLNVWDDPEPGDRGHNSAYIDISIIDPIDIMKYFGKEVDEIVKHDHDLSTNPYDGTTTSDDVAVSTMRGSEGNIYSVGGYNMINIDAITAREEEDCLKLTMATKGKLLADQPDEATAIYSLYMVEAEVDKQFIEPAITTDNLENMGIEYLYRFTFTNGELTGASTIDHEIEFTLNWTIEDDGYTLVIKIPTQELIAIEGEIDLDDDELIDVFGVASYTIITTSMGDIVQHYARDAAGSHSSGYPKDFWPTPFVPPPPENDKDDIAGGSMLWIILPVLGGVIGLVVILMVILMIRKKKGVGNGYREYTITKPGTHSGFSIGAPTPPSSHRQISAPTISQQQPTPPQYGGGGGCPQKQPYSMHFGALPK